MHKKNRKKKAINQRKYFYEFLAAGIPVLIILIAYIAMGVFPFGERAVMIIDSYHQYVPFFSELHDKIWHGDSLLYSWHGSLGYNFWSVQAYYLASPLNILIALFPASMMIEAFEFLIVLKIALSGITALWYLCWHSGRKNIMTVLFAEFYALGGFVLAYNWNVMWLDAIVLFPIVVMGIERLIQCRDWKIYTFSLGLTIFSNYYMAIMVCIFSVLYYFVVWFYGKKADGFLKTGFRFAGCSLLAGAIGAINLIPSYFTLMNSSQGSAPKEIEFYRGFFELIKQHFAFVEPTQLTGAPNIYCGIFLVLLVLFYMIETQIPWKEKTGRILLTVFLLFSLNFNYLDYIWHGFHFPNNLPGRFSFIYIMMIVIIAYDSLQYLKDIKLWQYIILLIFAAGLFAGCIIFSEETIELYTSIVSGIFLGLYIFLLICHRKDFHCMIKKYRFVPMTGLILLMTLELAGNGIFALCMNGTINRTTYTKDRAEVSDIREEYEGKNDLYRIELAEIRGRNDIVWHHLDGLSFFSSTADDRLEKFMGAIGLYNSGNKYSYKGATPLTDAILGIRYIISDDEMKASNLVLDQQTETKYIYENQNNLAVGYMVNADVMDWTITEGQPFEVQNNFKRLATGEEQPIFTQLTLPDPLIEGGTITRQSDDKWHYNSQGDESGSITWDLVFDEPQDVYLYFEASHCESMDVIVDGEKVTYTDQRGHIVHIGTYDANHVVTLSFPMDDAYTSGNIRLQMYAFDVNEWSKTYQKLSDEQFQVTKFDSTHLQGMISAQEDGLLMLSIPYDLGFSLNVDGIPSEFTTVGGTLIAIPLSAGTHQIELSFMPQGFKIGVGITIAAVFCCGILVWKDRKQTKRKSVI